ncbi:hypothetical protein ATL17_1581 [Maritalea mobilis]|uniref:Uncharacterized protein n=1 Tax=Maritalea mobilis TaxID=483324 RepID=A0A4R6VJL7_9HYPH|nr:hypothetical protein [Maritalea mobilis]TDQ63575.1 hypothetical protein ATL17_1581 [Maritalea mobilis]
MQVILRVNRYIGKKTQNPGDKIEVTKEVGELLIARNQADRAPTKRMPKAKSE